jgi:hypothetical protein
MIKEDIFLNYEICSNVKDILTLIYLMINAKMPIIFEVYPLIFLILSITQPIAYFSQFAQIVAYSIFHFSSMNL